MTHLIPSHFERQWHLAQDGKLAHFWFFVLPLALKGPCINAHSWSAWWYKSQQAAFMLRCEASAPRCPAVHTLPTTCSSMKLNKVASGAMCYTNCCNYVQGCGTIIRFKPLLSDIIKLIIKCAEGEAGRNLVNLFFLWFSPLIGFTLALKNWDILQMV